MAATIKRNVIVREKDKWFYGRVVRVLPNDEVLWLCCGLHFHIDHVDALVADGYKGYQDNGPWVESSSRFIFMTSLRKLKQRASRYHARNVWKTPLDYEFIQRAND